MKRLLILLTCLAALVAVVAAGATAAGKSHAALTLGATVDGTTVTLAGDLTGMSADVTVNAYAGVGCSEHHAIGHVPVTQTHGHFAGSTALDPGAYSFQAQASHHDETTWSGCVNATVATPPKLTLGAAVDEGVVTLSGAVTGVEHPVVTVFAYEGAMCSKFHPAGHVPVTMGLHGAFSGTTDALEPGAYSFQAVTPAGEDELTSDCVDVTIPTPEEPPVVVPPEEPVTPVQPYVEANTFLCWNRWMTNPVSYPDSVADKMWATGNYFEPQAILGNVEGGTNIGAYHLVCNAPATMVETNTAVGGSGEVYKTEAVTSYHLLHPANGNDLNVYHVYE